MEQNQIATKEDISEATALIISFIQKSLEDAKTLPLPDKLNKFLRSRDIKNMLGVCDNRLRDMRLKQEIPFTKLGDTFFYPESELMEALQKDLTPVKPQSNTGVRK